MADKMSSGLGKKTITKPLTAKLNRKQLDKFYKSYIWKKARKIILERDEYLCQRCLHETGQPIPADTVHHIVHLKDDPSKALDENNLISVCFSCHNELHPEKGFGVKKDFKATKKVKIVEVHSNPKNSFTSPLS